jgi:allophanate hydrolase subunit 1
MTKIQIHFRLRQPLSDESLAKLSDTNAIYGIRKIKVAPGLDKLMVEYDATRMRPAEVEAALAGAGIAVEPA